MTEEPVSEEIAPIQLVRVRIVETKGKSALVEWDDGRMHRAYVPVESLDGKLCPDNALKEAPVYGVPWELLLDLSGITPEAVADALRRKWIWTTEDAHAQSRALLTLGSGFIGNPVFRVVDELETKEAQ
jgi:hypothetical protein